MKVLAIFIFFICIYHSTINAQVAISDPVNTTESIITAGNTGNTVNKMIEQVK